MEASALRAPVGLTRGRSPLLLRLRTDDQLVALLRAGSHEAFDVIVDRYRARLLAYTRQMLGGSRQDAEDAMQDVWIRAFNALRADDRPITLRAWLYRVAHNRCIDVLRKPTADLEAVFDVSRQTAALPHEETERREDLRRLVEDVRRLPEAQRSALLMREMEGLSYDELAGALEVTVPAIKSLLVRARVGLVESAEARDVACQEIRASLLSSFDRGVRPTGLAKRHVRDCDGCRAYKTELRSTQKALAGLSPGGGLLEVLGKLLGIGGLGGSATAGASSGAGLVGGGAATLAGGTAAKVCAVACSLAVVGGAVHEVERYVVQAPGTRAEKAQVAKANPATAASPAPDRAAPPQVETATSTAHEPSPPKRAVAASTHVHVAAPAPAAEGHAHEPVVASTPPDPAYAVEEAQATVGDLLPERTEADPEPTAGTADPATDDGATLAALPQDPDDDAPAAGATAPQDERDGPLAVLGASSGTTTSTTPSGTATTPSATSAPTK